MKPSATLYMVWLCQAEDCPAGGDVTYDDGIVTCSACGRTYYCDPDDPTEAELLDDDQGDGAAADAPSGLVRVKPEYL